MTPPFDVRLAGLTARVIAPDDGLLAALAERLPPAAPAKASRRADVTWTLETAPGSSLVGIRRDGRAPGRARSREEAVERVAFQLALFFARRAEGLAFFHAGAVSWRGGAILLPGRSMSGKSTLVAALLSAGARYLSDELAPVDAAGRVHAWARPLSLRAPGRGADRLAPAALGASTAKGPVRVAAVVFLRHRPADVLRIERLSRGEAALGLLDNALAARSRPETSLCVARAVTERAALFRGTRGEAGETARALLEGVLAPP